jgi:hypothetical protein
VEIEAYWRPRNDTGIGFHYYPDMTHYSREDLAFWLPELQQLGASWLVLLSDPGIPIPDYFLGGLVSAGIEPLIRVYTPRVEPLDQTALARLCSAYAQLGVHYLHVFNEPNLVAEWQWTEWSKPSLVDRFMDLLIPCLETIGSAGLYPVFTPLAPGGNYWDTVFLKTALDYLVLKGKTHLFEKLAIGMHNYTLNKPLDWGKGGPSRWQDAKPYYTPPGCQDQMGFCLYEWVDAIVRARVGRSLPLLSFENGPIIGAHDSPDHPTVDETSHADMVLQMTRHLVDGHAPDYVFNNAFWLLRNGEGSPFEAAAWVRADGSRLRAMDALKRVPHPPRRMSFDSTDPMPTPVTAEKPLYHYVLCPTWEWGVSERYWRLLMAYVKAFKPACGFNPDEAALARYVTIIGRPPGVAQQVEEELKARGCLVERIGADDAAETQKTLDDLARRKQRFLTLAADPESKAN